MKRKSHNFHSKSLMLMLNQPWYLLNMWVFPKIVVPQNGWFILENLIKMDDLGVPLFSETAMWTFHRKRIGSRCRDSVPLFGFFSSCERSRPGSWQSKCCFCKTTHLSQQKSPCLTFWFPFWISKAGIKQKLTVEVHKTHPNKNHEYRTIPETKSLPMKIGHSKRKLIFQPSIFRCKLAASFREGKHRGLFV